MQHQDLAVTLLLPQGQWGGEGGEGRGREGQSVRHQDLAVSPLLSQGQWGEEKVVWGGGEGRGGTKCATSRSGRLSAPVSRSAVGRRRWGWGGGEGQSAQRQDLLLHSYLKVSQWEEKVGGRRVGREQSVQHQDLAVTLLLPQDQQEGGGGGGGAGGKGKKCSLNFL